MHTIEVASTYQKIQKKICSKLENTDGGAKFIADPWKSGLGEGVSMVLTNGDALEKAAVNFSAVKGKVTENMRNSLKIDAGDTFFATGISSIIHPKNPHSPIIHMNVRYFQLNSGQAWFGGGIDLTPHYVNIEESAWFHEQLEQLCSQSDAEFYSQFKPWADDYFYLPHREETRGVGGIFFDHLLAESDSQFDKLFAFTCELSKAYPKIYSNLLQKNRNVKFSEEEKKWQELRRGRYVEFNLLYDRGTRFGLDSGGRTESIFLSMPPLASWEYNPEIVEGSREWQTMQLLKKGIDWLIPQNIEM